MSFFILHKIWSAPKVELLGLLKAHNQGCFFFPWGVLYAICSWTGEIWDSNKLVLQGSSWNHTRWEILMWTSLCVSFCDGWSYYHLFVWFFWLRLKLLNNIIYAFWVTWILWWCSLWCDQTRNIHKLVKHMVEGGRTVFHESRLRQTSSWE